MKVEEFFNKEDSWNKMVLKELLPTWCQNIIGNSKIILEFESFKKVVPKVKHCVLVAAGPSLTDAEIEELSAYDGDVIVCNKVLKRFVGLGIEPDWCLLLDSNQISISQFEFLLDRPTKETKYLISSIASPRTVSLLVETVRQSNIYLFNPHTDTGGEIALSTVWEWMNGAPVLCHGGNVGCMAFNFAKVLGYEKIALLGYDMYEEPNPNWTMKEAGEREFFYYPDINKTIAIPFHFLTYSQYLLNAIEEWQTKKIGGPREAINLGESPLMRHSPVLTQMKVREYVEWTKRL